MWLLGLAAAGLWRYERGSGARAALEHAADGLGDAHVGITDHELDARETSLLEGSNEGFPETLAFAVNNL